jgi:outer membrane autotransporter protein
LLSFPVQMTTWPAVGQLTAYTDATYLGGGDVDQNWGANLGVKYTW